MNSLLKKYIVIGAVYGKHQKCKDKWCQDYNHVALIIINTKYKQLTLY